MPELCQYRLDGDVAVLTMDDGKANALSHDMIDAIGTGLDRAADDAKALVLAGRDGRFSAGFDLSVMGSGIDAVRGLVEAGGRLCMRLYTFELPVVAACTGHALAAGAIVLMASDWRVGAEGDFKIGLNEVAIGMPLPQFAADLAADRLSKRHFPRATGLAEIYDPHTAVDAGYLDVTAADPVAAAIETATELAGRLSGPAFAGTRRTTRHATAHRLEQGMTVDLAHFEVDA